MSLVDYDKLDAQERTNLLQTFTRLKENPDWKVYEDWLDFQIESYDDQLRRVTFTDLNQVLVLQEKRALCILLKGAPDQMIDLFTPGKDKMPDQDVYDKPVDPNAPKTS